MNLTLYLTAVLALYCNNCNCIATVVLHGQAMNGLRRSFLCRVKMGGNDKEADSQVMGIQYT